MSFDKKNEEVSILSFANYSIGLFANKKSVDAIEKQVDYSQIDFSVDPNKLNLLGKQLGKIGQIIENAYNGDPQDIEGAIIYDDSHMPKIYIVQTRNQV